MQRVYNLKYKSRLHLVIYVLKVRFKAEMIKQKQIAKRINLS